MKFDKVLIKKIFYLVYVLIFLVFIGGAIITPFVAFSDEKTARSLYDAYAQTCHQKLSRSFCVFEENSAFSFGDCTPQTGVFVNNDNRIIKSVMDGKVGYKIAVCSRDVGIYGAMVLAALFYPLFRKWDSGDVPPGIYLIILLIPLAIDGTAQLLGSFGIFGFYYESTNLIRLLTGVLAGAAITFYIIPLGMNIIDQMKL